MTDDEFDAALVAAAFALGADEGWSKVSAAAAAQRAGLDLATARTRFAHRGAVLLKFGALADVHALTGALTEGSVRDRLFDILLRRFDFLQLHRAGVVALLKSLPLMPALAPLLAKATLESMGWMLEAAGVAARGPRAWLQDETTDLAATMAAVDVALNRADQIAARFADSSAPAEPEPPIIEPELPLVAGEDEPPAVL